MERKPQGLFLLIFMPLASLTDRRDGSLTLEYGRWCRPKRKAPACYSTGS